MEDLGKLSPKLSPRQHAVLLEMYRHPEHPVHRSPTNLTLKALRRKGLVELSWKDSVAGYMFGRQPCWNITDAGRRRILGVLGNTMDKEQSEDHPSIPEFEKIDAKKLYEALETIAELEKKWDESEKRTRDLAELEQPQVVGYRSAASRMVYEKDYGLQNPEPMMLVSQHDRIAGALLADLASMTKARNRYNDLWNRAGNRLALAQVEIRKLTSERDAALARVAELEKALAESEKRGSELAASYCDGVIGDEYGRPHCRYKVERDAALAKLAELEKPDPDYTQHPQIVGYARKKELEPLLDPCQPDGGHIYIGLDHPSLWTEEPPYEFLTPLYTAPVTQAQHSVPDGWKLVPMDPTSQMTLVGQSLRSDSVNSIGEIYRQMLAVAPSPIDPAAHPQPCQQPQAHPARCGCER
ncbi:hypothetical protein 21_00022 [Pseudomonas phage Epa21]|uniref:Uncharacterized protein n=1 Tax=Pseudomonas phage Epa21 TaxID=2719191 RepID=A0A6G9LK96_9CAUD|nr:hypothetical protein 21_00022 [Pseudomonas phage Epa21]